LAQGGCGCGAVLMMSSVDGTCLGGSRIVARLIRALLQALDLICAEDVSAKHKTTPFLNDTNKKLIFTHLSGIFTLPHAMYSIYGVWCIGRKYETGHGATVFITWPS
jgi:hypothetical protein